MHEQRFGRAFARLTSRRALGFASVVLLAACSSSTQHGTPASSHQNASTAPTIAALASRVDLATNATEPVLVNPWGLAFAPAGFAWISDNGSGDASVHDASGALLRSIPLPSPTMIGAATPTGMVMNPRGDELLGDAFVMVTEDGTVVGWQERGGAQLRVDASASGAVYKGATIIEAQVPCTGGQQQQQQQQQQQTPAQQQQQGSTVTEELLLAADFHNGRIDIYDANYQPLVVSGPRFVDSAIPAGFAPFNVKALQGMVFVTYAKQDAVAHDDVPGPGNGFIDVFDVNGKLVQRLVSGGTLNSPWGMTMLPADEVTIAGSLLVGNFGDGRITAFSLAATSGRVDVTELGLIGVDASTPLVIEGLWSLEVGVDAGGFSSHAVYFTAGPNDEKNGVLGRLDLQQCPNHP